MEKADIIRKAIANGRVCKGKIIRVSVREVVKMFENCSKPGTHVGVKVDSKALLEKMAEAGWEITEDKHITDWGGRFPGRAEEKTFHLDVKVLGIVYHLLLNASDHIFQVKGWKNGVISCGIPPYLAPGSVQNPKNTK